MANGVNIVAVEPLDKVKVADEPSLESPMGIWKQETSLMNLLRTKILDVICFHDSGATLERVPFRFYIWSSTEFANLSVLFDKIC